MSQFYSFLRCISASALFTSLTACSADITNVPQAVMENEKLALLADVCPLDLMPETPADYFSQSRACEASQSSCFKKCRRGDENACLDLANIYVLEDETYAPSQLLFKRSCQLGLPSGCTNAAAGMLHFDKSQDGTCSVGSFEATCSKGDPWGCTMQAIMLSDKRYIDMIERDFDAALSALKGSCKFGLDDEACSTAKEMEVMIREMMEK